MVARRGHLGVMRAAGGQWQKTEAKWHVLRPRDRRWFACLVKKKGASVVTAGSVSAKDVDRQCDLVMSPTAPWTEMIHLQPPCQHRLRAASQETESSSLVCPSVSLAPGSERAV